MATNVENDEESFIILGSSPGTSLDLKCNGDAMENESEDKNQINNALKGLSNEAEMAFKAHFNLGECPSPASLMMASTIVSEDKSTEELQKKFGEILDENIILKETLKQNNDSIKEQFLLIASCQEDMMKAHQLHKEKFNETRELVEKLRAENKKLKQDIAKLSEAGPASLRKSQVNGETGEAVDRGKSAPNSGVYEFVASPDDDTIDKLTAQLELVEKQRRQVIVENEKLSWQKESLEHIVDTTSKERDELKEKIKNLELQNSNIRTQFEDEIRILKKNLYDTQETYESSKGLNNDEMLRKDLIVQELSSKVSTLQSELKTSQLKVLELENVKLEFSKQKSGVIETIKLYREQIQDLDSRLKEAQKTVFQPVRFSISSETDSTEFSSLLNNVKLYDKTLKHLSELLNAMTQGTSESLTKTMDLTIKLNGVKLGMDNPDTIKSGLMEIKAIVEQQHSNMLNVIGQIRGTLSIFEGIFQDFKELLKKNESNENTPKKPLQRISSPNIDALTAALVSRGQELEAAEKELIKLRQLATTLQKESEERDHLKAQLDVYL
ncbi:hypothetical protein EVAR_40985_1 [Eumeta japonica]|uniref:Uncharacterized protein n=1 Tax=Eumeta variegata TaxID=151549 RepID=A0A4C1XIB0_EUMVA|nr:hypothetical protein EVAR_40985_1 [Eumeta japonica]